MPIKVRSADLQFDREELIHFLHENLTDRSDGSRFDWLYLQNPNGSARAWIAVDETTRRTIGVAGAFPRSMWFNGQIRQAYILGDFCVAPESRSLGPALSLQRACLNDLGSDEQTVCVDFPSDRMVAIYRRLGIQTAGNLVRYVKLLRVDAKMRSLVPQPALARGINVVGNLALRLRDGWPSTDADLTVGIHERAFDDEFTKLNSRAAAFYPVHGLRSAEYLNWRYLQNPLRKFSVVAARRGGELAAYAVIVTNDSEWSLTDLFAADDAGAVAGILAHVHRLARQHKIERLTTLMMESSPFSAPLRSAGFYPRERHPVIVYAENHRSTPAPDPMNWFLMDGDRES